jgi:hypothetical protein
VAGILGGNTARNQFMAGMLGMLVLAVIMYFVISNGQNDEVQE